MKTITHSLSKGSFAPDARFLFPWGPGQYKVALSVAVRELAPDVTDILNNAVSFQLAGTPINGVVQLSNYGSLSTSGTSVIATGLVFITDAVPELAFGINGEWAGTFVVEFLLTAEQL
jgi:hypothetical protein